MRARRYAAPRDDRRRNGPVVAVRPLPGLWREALRLAGGDASRLEVLPDRTVVVHNRPRGRAR